jgi:hypothetical protein
VEQLEARLAREGCRAADYRLTGDLVHHLCVSHLKGITGNWRVLIGFPRPTEVTILDVDQHSQRRGRNIYRRLYATLGIPEPTGPRTKPKCCVDGEPPVTPALIERIELAARSLTQMR